MRSNFCPCRLQSERGVKGRMNAPSEDRVSGKRPAGGALLTWPHPRKRHLTLDDLRTKQISAATHPPPHLRQPVPSVPCSTLTAAEMSPSLSPGGTSEPKTPIGGSRLQPFFSSIFYKLRFLCGTASRGSKTNQEFKKTEISKSQH